MNTMSTDEKTPLTIDGAEAGDAITVRWADGHQSTYGAAQLRRTCPCAICRAAATPKKGRGLALPQALTPAQLTITDAAPVGRYGLSLAWGDGHNTGIYAFDALRRACPCPACRAAFG